MSERDIVDQVRSHAHVRVGGMILASRLSSVDTTQAAARRLTRSAPQ
jgi:hypothetical protein